MKVKQSPCHSQEVQRSELVQKEAEWQREQAMTEAREIREEWDRMRRRADDAEEERTIVQAQLDEAQRQMSVVQ